MAKQAGAWRPVLPPPCGVSPPWWAGELALRRCGMRRDGSPIGRCTLEAVAQASGRVASALALGPDLNRVAIDGGEPGTVIFGRWWTTHATEASPSWTASRARGAARSVSPRPCPPPWTPRLGGRRPCGGRSGRAAVRGDHRAEPGRVCRRSQALDPGGQAVELRELSGGPCQPRLRRRRVGPGAHRVVVSAPPVSRSGCLLSRSGSACPPCRSSCPRRPGCRHRPAAGSGCSPPR